MRARDELDSGHLLLNLVGEEMLTEVASETLDLLQTSSVIFERSGECAVTVFSSTWCRLLNEISKDFCCSHDGCKSAKCGVWNCREFCWNAGAQQAIQTRGPMDVACAAGLRVYALPISAGKEAVGSIAFSYGEPPRDAITLQPLADKYRISVEQLRAAAEAYEARSPQIVEAAKRRLHTTARLIGAIVERKLAEQSEQTARAQAEAARQQMENIVDSIADSFLAVDPQWRLTFVNRRVEELIGRPARDLLGKNVWRQFPVEARHGVFFELCSKVMRERVPIEFEEFAPSVGKWFEVRAFPMGDGGVAAFGRDITDRKRLACELENVQAESRKQHEFLQEFVQHAPVAVAMFDRKMRYVLVTDRWLNDHKRTREQVIGRSHYRVFPGVPERWKEVHRRVLATGLPEKCEEDSVRRRDGSVWWLKWETRTWGDSGEDTGGIFIATEDITERKLAQEALIRTEKLASVGRMAATIAHEINNPLAAVMNSVYLAWLDPNLSEQTRASLDVAQQELERIAQITKQTLGFHRETGAPSSVELSEVMENVLQLYAPRLKNKNISVTTKYAAPAAVMGTAGELRQVISNLVANSIDAVPQHGRLQLRVRPVIENGHAASVRVTVADNGTGIAPGNLKSIFEPFFTTKRSVGTGLGLWVTKEILKKHGGSIRVRSRTGAGTVFIISLSTGSPDNPDNKGSDAI